MKAKKPEVKVECVSKQEEVKPIMRTKMEVLMELPGQTCDPSTGEVEAGGVGVQGHPWLLREFLVSLGYMRPSLKTSKTSQANQNPARGRWNLHDSLLLDLRSHRSLSNAGSFLFVCLLLL